MPARPHNARDHERAVLIPRDLFWFLIGLDTSSRCRTRIRHAVRSIGIESVAELEKALRSGELAQKDNLGPRSLKALRKEFNNKE